VQVAPFSGQSDAPLSGAIQWTNVGATSYQVFFGAAGSGCNSLAGTVNGGTSFSYTGLSPNTNYESRIVAVRSGCPSMSSQCIRWSTTGPPCNLAAPQIVSPLNGSNATSPVKLQWNAVTGAQSYHVVVQLNGNTVADLTTTDTFADVKIGNGNVSWTVTALAGSCTSPASTGAFNTCSPPDPPLAGVVGAPSSGNAYSVVVVNPSAANVRYEFQEADNDAFQNAKITETTSPSVEYTHETTGANPLVFFYRVRAFGNCTSAPGAFSKTIRVVILPIVVDLRAPTINVPAGTKNLVVQQVFIPGESGPVNFTAFADRPWIVKLFPTSGILLPAPGGVTLDVTIDPSLLPNGTFTATVIVNILSSITTGAITPNANTTKSAPVTINLVTPVVPVDPKEPSPDSLIIPAVGRLAGLNSQWRSDVRIFNNSGQKLQYLLNFTAIGSTDVKQTTIDTDIGATTALDDIIHNWYGVGEVGDSATGILEVRPVAPVSNNPLSTIVASRTFNQTANGTLGQFIPAVQYKNFVSVGSRLSIQQISQTATSRSNFAVVEASGKPVSVLLSMFNSAGTKLFDLPIDLKGGEQKLLNNLLAQQGVTSLSDGRLEVRVTDGGGKVTAYGSVIDTANGDPLFVPGKPLGAAVERTYVVPGAADLKNAAANWQTDMRIFNSGSVAQTVNLTFYQANNAAAPRSATMTVNPNEVKVLDSVLQSVFAAQNVAGAVHADTPTDSQLVITARTFNQTASGTLGQFIDAATLADGIVRAGRALNILQVEDSTRYRTNVGLAEMSGKPSTVEISVTLPDSKVTPSIQVPLAANEFRQFGLAEFGLGNVYNARVSLKVVDGDGRVTAYGSVIDQSTTAPTYVKAQQ
jgi:hypothetical protein